MPTVIANRRQTRHSAMSIACCASFLRPLRIMISMVGVPSWAWRASSDWMLVIRFAKVWSPTFAASVAKPIIWRLVSAVSNAKETMTEEVTASRVIMMSSIAWRPPSTAQFRECCARWAQSYWRSRRTSSCGK